MNHNEFVRRSTLATLTEITETHRALELPPEPQEVAEALEIVQRIEGRVRSLDFYANRNWRPLGAAAAKVVERLAEKQPPNPEQSSKPTTDHG